MYPATDEFKSTAEISLSGLEVVAYRENLEDDITEWVIGVSEVKNAIHSQRGGYAASISPTLTITVLQSDEMDALLKDLGAGTLSIRVSTYNFLEEAGGGVGEKVKLFDGLLAKQDTYNRDVYGKVYELTFAHPLVVYDKLGKIDLSRLPDPYDYSQMESYGEGEFGRRDLKAIFKSINVLMDGPFGPKASLNIDLYNNEGVKFYKEISQLQETHTPIHRKKNGTTFEDEEYEVLGSSVENFVKIRGVAYNESEDILIVGIDDMQVDATTNEVTHTPRLCYLQFEGGFLRMEHKPVKLWYTGDWTYRCPNGYRILDLHYDFNTEKIYFVVETAQDDLDDKIDGEDTGIYFEGNQFRMRTEGGDQGEKSPRIYFGEVDWADRKDVIQFNHTKRLKKYHKGIHIYSRHTEWSSTTNIDDPRGIGEGSWRGIHYSQMIGSGTPETEKSLGVPLPYNRLVATSAEDIVVDQQEFLVKSFGQAWTNPLKKPTDYITEGSHMYVFMVDKDPENEFAIKGNICYLGDILKVVPAGLDTYKVTTRKKSLFGYDPYEEVRIRFVIVPDYDHPYDNISIPEYSSLEVVYNDGPDWFQYPWTTKKEINIESRRELQQRINFFFKKNVDKISESTSFEPDPGLYSFSANAEVEGFSGYRGTFLAPKPSNWGYWNPTGQWTKKTIDDGTWTSAKPIPFHLVYKFIDDSNQFKWRYKDGNIQRFAVCNNNNDKGLLNPDAGRPNVNQPHFKSLLVVYYNGAWRPVERVNGGRLKSYGNVWLSLAENNDLWIFVNDFEKANWPVTSQTAIEWFNTCKIYKWKDDTNYPAGGYVREVFKDRRQNESLGREYFFNYIGTNSYTGELNQPQRLPRLFTGPGVFNSGGVIRWLGGGRKTLMYNRDNTGIKVLGAYHVELGYDGATRPGVAGIKGYSGGVQPVLVLEGDVSEKFDVGDTIELRWSKDSKNNGVPNPLYVPHVTYQILDVETMTINFLDAPKIMKGEYKPDKETVNQEDENNYRKFGFWTLVTIESINLKSYPQFADPDIVQLSVLQACVEKNIIPQSKQGTEPGQGGIVVNLAGNIQRIDNTENYYYIYKVGKKWEFADRYQINTEGSLAEQIEDFDRGTLVDISTYHAVEQTRLPGEQYKLHDGTDLGETLTPKIDLTYSKLPYVTLSKKQFYYFSWLYDIISLGEKYRTSYADNILLGGYIVIKLKDSKKRLAVKLIFDNTDVVEPDLTTVLVKPNTGDNLTECRLFFNRELEGVDVLVDYWYFLDGYTDGIRVSGDGGNVAYRIFNSNERPIYTSYGYKVSGSGAIQTQNGVVGTPISIGRYKEAMISRPDNNLMIINSKSTGYIEEINTKNKKMWDLISSLAITNNCYVIPDSARYNEKTASSNPMNITLYQRSFKGIIPTEINPTKIKKITKEEYNSVVVNYKHGKAIVILTRSGGIQSWHVEKGNKYEVSCEYISDYYHAVMVAKTILQWLFFGVEYELQLGYLASWLQVLDSVIYKTNETNEEGMEVEVWETAYITSVTHRVGQEGNGTTTLKVVSYTDSQGEPFNPGNPEYKQEPA